MKIQVKGVERERGGEREREEKNRKIVLQNLSKGYKSSGPLFYSAKYRTKIFKIIKLSLTINPPSLL